MSRLSFALLSSVLLLSSSAHATDDAQASPEKVTKPATQTVVPSRLSLDQAIERALAASPRLRGAAEAVLASRGDRIQAGLWPNPDLGIEASNVAGTGPYNGFNSAETTLSVSQLIEIGGKRSSRRDIADHAVAASGYELEAERFNLIRDVTAAYIDAVAAEERLKIANETVALANDVFRETQRRVAEAASPLSQKSRAEVILATAKIAAETAKREVLQAKRKLGSFWLAREDAIELDHSVFDLSKAPVPAFEIPTDSPDLNRWDEEFKRSQAEVDLAHANAVPDPRISVGFRDFRDTKDRAVVVGLTIPIPILNQNQGNIERAIHNSRKVRSDAENAKLQLSLELLQQQKDMEIGYAEAKSLEDTVIPAAERTLSLSRQGYALGRFPFLEVLDSQKALFDAKNQRVTALRNYHIARAAVVRLAAQSKQQDVRDTDHE